MRIFTATLLKKKIRNVISLYKPCVFRHVAWGEGGGGATCLVFNDLLPAKCHRPNSSAYIKKNIHSINKKINKEKTTRERF